jgi:hypothetical protein
MTLPTDGFGVLTLVILVVPGIVFASTRSSLRGRRAGDQSAAIRLLEGTITSIIFSSIYVVVFAGLLGPALADPIATFRDDPRLWSVALLGLGIVVPALISWLVYGSAPFLARPRAAAAWVRGKLIGTGFVDTPTAWDWAPNVVGPCWVRVRIAPGDWVGGKYSGNAQTSTYPEPRDLFFEEPWHMDSKGQFVEKVTGGRGCWVAIRDEYVVEWVNMSDDDKTEEEPA